ncbi:ribosome small subunit-dependent GTPase A [Methanocalculus sp.]|uniref:ribosome small subunit-dependent GTPase A n=1 Tax=Methanocalculus sp. TaxID=2004547 RepID=UPI00260B34B4|nr:ribosome small subunit-dependent GTPase A [Methanocalculus sp.]MDG6250845.1 ribosome small subunit-dependent GTPase A [Methanocalculus sp.]
MSISPSSCNPSHIHSLEEIGWNEELDRAFSKYNGPYLPGRVACRQKTVFNLLIKDGQVTAGLSGAMRKLGRYPAVGDFVVLFSQPEAGTLTIVDILPQKNRFSRGTSGRESSDQVIAANIDYVFIMTAAGHDFNLRRIERYLVIAHASGVCPVVVLNKTDLADDPAILIDEIHSITSDIPVIPISAVSGEGVEGLDPYLLPGKTITLIGSSGVGKSTLINRLLENLVQETSHIRENDGRGRHTTTVRQLFILKSGALMIDNPGLREVGIGCASEGIADTFPDILELAEECRFSDCQHEEEPGCAVKAAVQNGLLPASRLESYQRLMRELAFEQEKAEIGLVQYERKRWKGIAKFAKDIQKSKER